MNEFGKNLKGLKGVFKRATFWNPKADVAERTCTIEDGPGCHASDPGRKLKVRWLSDNTPDTITSYDLESIIDDKGNVIPRKDANVIDDTPALFLSNGTKNVEAPAAKPKGRNAWAPMPAEETGQHKQTFAGLDLASKVDIALPPATVASIVEGVVSASFRPAPAEIPGTRKAKGYDVTLAVAMYAEGKTIAEIAAAQGFTPGNGLNKTRVALREAGVWKGK